MRWRTTPWLSLAWVMLSLAGTLAGCAMAPPPPRVVPEDPETVAVVPPEPPILKSQPLHHLANRNLKPLPDVPVNAKTKCSFHDPTGYRGQLDLRVSASKVERFATAITIPKRGECRFDLASFHQQASGPTVTLNHNSSECTVRMWPQGNQVTVAFHDCPQQCSGDSFDYLWPILVDAKTGRCS